MDLVVARVGQVAAGLDHRFLIDRLWPRGIRKDRTPWDAWAPAVAPSTDRRRWSAHDPQRYPAFREPYEAERMTLTDHPAMRGIVELATSLPVALLTATRDLEHSHAPVREAFIRHQRP